MLAQIHWFSIINSCVTVLLLTGFLATILMRVLKNDFIKYTRDDDGRPDPRSSPGHSSLAHDACLLGMIQKGFQCSSLTELQHSFGAPLGLGTAVLRLCDETLPEAGVESIHLKVAAFRRCTMAHTWLHG